MGSILDRYKKGLDVPKVELDAVEESVLLSENPEIAKKFDAIKRTGEFRKEIAKFPPRALQDLINNKLFPAAQRDGATEFESTRLEMAQGLLNTARSELSKDPISYSAKVGVTEIEPIDFSGEVDDIASQLHDRLGDAQITADYFGSDFKIFTDEEATQFTSFVEDLGPEDKLAFGLQLSEGLGSRTPDALEQLGEKNGLYAHAVALGQTNKRSAVKILRGQQVLRENPDMKVDQPLAKQFYREYVGTAFSLLPETDHIVKQASDALYADARFAGEVEETFDDTDYERFVREAIGGDPNNDETGIHEFNDQKFILPTNVDQDNFDNLADSITDSDLGRLSVGGELPKYANGETATWEEIQDNGVLRTYAPGQYMIFMNAGPNSGFLQGSGDRGLFILDFERRHRTEHWRWWWLLARYYDFCRNIKKHSS